MMIGKFTQADEGYIGSIRCLGLDMAEVTISPVPAKQGNGPDFVIIGANLEHEFELGAAWAKTSKDGKPYLSVKLDGPMLAAPIHCALIEQQHGGHGLIWTRDSGKTEVQAAA